MPFSVFQSAVQRQFTSMQDDPLFTVDVDGDLLWQTYLQAYPPGSNLLFRKNTEHDCSCCRHFIRTIGGLVTIDPGTLELTSLWDLQVAEPYQTVAKTLAALVRSRPIKNIFLHPEISVGTARSRSFLLAETGVESSVVTFDHFYVQLPRTVVMKDRGTAFGMHQTGHDVLARAVAEIDPAAVITAQELIAQGSLYRGDEHARTLNTFSEFQVRWIPQSEVRRDRLCWLGVARMVPAPTVHIRNSSIGTLLMDLSGGRDLDEAVAAFETKVAPANYKRPTALVTKAMLDRARATLEELGLVSALERRYAVLEDVSVNNVLFADRAARKRLQSALDKIAPTAPTTKKLDRVDEISIDDFIANVLPKAISIEALFENRHTGNLVSLVAPVDLTAKPLFKWNNPFSWSYNGDLADSIKERVKRAGGNVAGDLRCSLSWYNYDDLDLHMVEPTPGGDHVYFGYRHSRLGGMLDVDMNAGRGSTREPVENITYASRRTMLPGVYVLTVHNYCQRETIDCGFTVEIEFDGNIHMFTYPKAVRASETIQVAQIQYDGRNFVAVTSKLESVQATRTVWNLPTQTFHPVSAIMPSPNYWSGDGIGNKHFFFMLDGCKNEGQARGIYNEFLSSELDKHRKALELIGARMKTETAADQLSGLGFSATKRDHLLCNVKGSFNRTIKVTF
jgi:hypothetical protein